MHDHLELQAESTATHPDPILDLSDRASHLTAKSFSNLSLAQPVAVSCLALPE
jgi:hypothetical protein